MKKGNLAKYILIAVLAGAAFIVGWAFIDSAILKTTETFADGFKSVINWILAVCFGISCAYSPWKKDNKDGKDSKDEKKA